MNNYSLVMLPLLFIAAHCLIAVSATEVCIQPSETACFTVQEAQNKRSDTENDVSVIEVERGAYKDEIDQLNQQIQDLKSQLRLLTSNPEELFCPLGMKNGNIADSQLSESSHRTHPKKDPKWSSAANARLDGTHTWQQFGGWHPANTVGYFKQWIQVDLLESRKVTGIVTQGRANGDKYDQYMTSFKIRYGDDESKLWPIVKEDREHIIFDGNENRNGKKITFFPEPITARFVRVVVWSWHRVPVLRIELLGC